MEDQLLKEYEFLRNEIDQQQSLHNTLVTFTITTVVAVISFAATQSNPIMYLFAYCIIIPMSIRIAYYRKAMAKISAYMIVFLEPKLDGISWETRNLEFSKRFGGLSHRKKKLKLDYYECLVLSIVCYFLFLFSNISGRVLDYQLILECAIPSLLVVWEGVITYRINEIDRDREKMEKDWKACGIT